MKFGNYNLTAASEKHNRLFFARLKKVKSTSNYLAGKFERQINTIRNINGNLGRRKARPDLTDSPLSYRASLFDNRNHLQSEKCRELREKLERFRTDDSVYESCGSQKYQPTDFHRPSSSLFDDRKSPNELCVFDKVKFSKLNNAITGKRQHKMLKNVYFTINSNTCANSSSLYESVSFDASRPEGGRKSYKFSPPRMVEEPKIRMDLSTLLKATPFDEKAELEILRNYFDAMSYSEICKDSDFKNYLKKKNYQDAIDYIYSGTSLMGSSLRGDKSSIYGAATDVLRRYYDLDLEIVKESNDCDSIKNEKLPDPKAPSIDSRKYFSQDNSQFFCKSNKEFDDYYQRNQNIFYEATKTVDDDFFQKDLGDLYRTYERASRLYTERKDDESLIDELYGHKSQPFIYCTMPTRKIAPVRNEIPFHADEYASADEGNNSEFTKYQTYPLKKKAKRSYEQLLRYCEKTLAAYSTNDISVEKWEKLAKKDFSEKTYNKIIKAFARLRGFESVEAYVQYHYGRALDKSFDANLKLRLREALSRHDEQLVISKPILRMTTQGAVTISNRTDSMPPPYTSGGFDCDNNYFYKRHQACGAKSKTNDDCFKHYDYVDMSSDKPASSSLDGNDTNRVLFRFVEDMKDNGIDFDELLAGRHSRSCENIRATRNTPISDRVSANNGFDRKLSELGKRSVDNIYESIRGEAGPKRAGLHKHHNQRCTERRRARHAKTQNVIPKLPSDFFQEITTLPQRERKAQIF